MPDPEQLITTVIRAIGREYPHHLAHVYTGPQDAATPRQLHPCFYGSYDWHSCVHNHWLLVYALRRWPDTMTQPIQDLLDAHLTVDNIAVESTYFDPPVRKAWERPYGWAWTVRLLAELGASTHPHARTWHAALQPLADRLQTGALAYLHQLPFPVTTGTHANTAFCLTLLLESATMTDQRDLVGELADIAVRLYGSPTPATAAQPPSHGDFLAPHLAAADLMGAVLPRAGFRDWLNAYLPALGRSGPTVPAADNNIDDPAGSHLEGLNLTSSWALTSIAAALETTDPRIPNLVRAADEHARRGSVHVGDGHFLVDHWMPTFVGYLDSRRQLAQVGR